MRAFNLSNALFAPLALVSLTSLALVSLVGCGQESPLPPAPRPTPYPHFSTPAPTPSAAIDPQSRQLVARGLAVLDGFKTIEGTLHFEEWGESKQERGQARFLFRHRPFAARIEMVESERWLAAGSVVLWDGGEQLKIRPLGMPISVRMGLSNGQVVSPRGYRVDQTDLFSMGKVLAHPGARYRPLGTRRVRGEDLFMLAVESPASLPDVTREVIGLHQRSGLPTYREMYVGNRMVHKGQGVGLKIDKPVDTTRFEF